MRNIKFISVFAAIGFILSFLFGLFSHSSFISILLKALIFSVVFCGLGFLITFLANKFLLDQTVDGETVDLSDLGSKSHSENHNVAQNIDIEVKDEELPSSDTDNHFDVGNNHQMLKNSDIKEDNSSSAVDVGQEPQSQFVPLRKVETPENFSGAEAKTPKEMVSEETTEPLEDSIDTLPDMETLNVSQDDGTGESNNDTFSFSNLDSSENTYKKSDGNLPDVKDAGLIAKAISTALAGEDS